MKLPLKFSHRTYVPCLRWKMGEYQALLRLSSKAKGRLRPLIEVAEMSWDFAKKRMAKTIDQHLEDVAKNVATKWGSTPALVDLKHISRFDRMANGIHPATYLFQDLRSRGAMAVPVSPLSPDAALLPALRDVIRLDRNGVCLRVNLAQVGNKDFAAALATLLSFYGVPPEEVDVVLDLEAPAFDPLDGFTKMVKANLDRLPSPLRWRSLTVLGTSFPASMGSLSLGNQSIQRKEWLFYKKLLSMLKPGERVPSFGDYAIAHPALVPKDPRLLKPAATIRYATDDQWIVIKGKNLRDNGNGQYRNFCRDLISTSAYSGRHFSAADEFIAQCAAGRGNLGNLSTWRWVGTNHHLEKVVSDLASLSAF